MLARLVFVSALGVSGATLARAQSSISGAERATLVVTGTGEVSRPPDTAQISPLPRDAAGRRSTARRGDHRLRVAQAAPVLDRLRAAGFTVDEGSFSLSEERAAAAPAAHAGDDRPTYRASTRYDSHRPVARGPRRPRGRRRRGGVVSRSAPCASPWRTSGPFSTTSVGPPWRTRGIRPRSMPMRARSASTGSTASSTGRAAVARRSPLRPAPPESPCGFGRHRAAEDAFILRQRPG